MIPGISFALVPRHYLGEALFSRGLYAEVRGSNNALGSDADFLQIRLQAERVFDIAPKWHVLLRGDLGATALSKTSGLAPSQRFFAGGDRSVRGFGKDDLSPITPVIDPDTGLQEVDENNNPIYQKLGGKHLFAGSVELVRDLPKNFAVAVFADAGNAFDNFGDPLMYSVGIGFRLRLDEADGNKNNPAWSAMAWVGIEANGDNAIDVFLGIGTQGSNPVFGIFAPGTSANTSPSTTSIASSPTYSYTRTVDNYDYRAVNYLTDGGTTNDATPATTGGSPKSRS